MSFWDEARPSASSSLMVVACATSSSSVSYTHLAGFDDVADTQMSRPSAARVAAPVAQQRPAAPVAKAPAAETTRISQVSTRRPQHRADVAAPVREVAPAPVEAPAAVEYEESESEHSFEAVSYTHLHCAYRCRQPGYPRLHVVR